MPEIVYVLQVIPKSKRRMIIDAKVLEFVDKA